MDAKEQLRLLIKEKETELQALRTALRSLEQSASKRHDPALPYKDARPLDVIRDILKENGGSMQVDVLTEKLIAGGLTEGKKRKHHNIRISIETNERIGNLVVEGDVVRLPHH